jgi:hypothetical protein
VLCRALVEFPFQTHQRPAHVFLIRCCNNLYRTRYCTWIFLLYEKPDLLDKCRVQLATIKAKSEAMKYRQDFEVAKFKSKFDMSRLDLDRNGSNAESQADSESSGSRLASVGGSEIDAGSAFNEPVNVRSPALQSECTPSRASAASVLSSGKASNAYWEGCTAAWLLSLLTACLINLQSPAIVISPQLAASQR